MDMYHTEKVYTPERFRAELSQFVLRMRRKFTQDIQYRCDKCELGKFPPYLPLYR